ncbi:MAG TPA: hypothetical protein VGN61_00610 [Verrucomicrobiae bacterium]
MKTLLAKFRISNALDKDDPAQSQSNNSAASGGLNEFAQRTAAVNRALRRPPATPLVDARLHQSIMRAVRANANAKDVAPSPKIWLITGVTAMAALCILVMVRHGTPAPQSDGSQTFAAAQDVFDMGAQVSRSMPAAVVAPLSNELASVDHDIRNTTKFLLASLP